MCKQLVLETALARLKSLQDENLSLQQKMTNKGDASIKKSLSSDSVECVDFALLFQSNLTPSAVLTLQGEILLLNNELQKLTSMDLKKATVMLFDLIDESAHADVLKKTLMVCGKQESKALVYIHLPGQECGRNAYISLVSDIGGTTGVNFLITVL